MDRPAVPSAEDGRILRPVAADGLQPGAEGRRQQSGRKAAGAFVVRSAALRTALSRAYSLFSSSAVLSFRLLRMWVYTSRVSVMLECPSSSCASFSSTPASNRMVA